RHVNWKPDMIYFDNTNIVRSANYYVQQLFGQNAGDTYLPMTVEPAITDFSISCVRDSKTDDVILKLVNAGTNAVTARIDLTGIGKISAEATQIVLQGAPNGNNSFEHPYDVAPK